MTAKHLVSVVCVSPWRVAAGWVRPAALPCKPTATLQTRGVMLGAAGNPVAS